MITRIQACGFRCFKEVDQDLREFQALIGLNASGKSAFLDLIAFVSDVLSADGGLEKAVEKRTDNFRDLLWNRSGNSFSLALEAEIPERLRKKMEASAKGCNRVRYELTVREMEIHQESLVFLPSPKTKDMPQSDLRVAENEAAEYLVKDVKKRASAKKKVIVKRGVKDNYCPEAGQGRKSSAAYDRKFSTLAHLPGGAKDFPVAHWFRSLLRTGLRNVVLDNRTMKMPSRPGQPREFQPGGSNIPWRIEHLKTQNPDRFQRWLGHVRTALEDMKQIHVIERKEDGCKYLQIEYQNGVKVPSWMLSDGTLRFLALTLIAYPPQKLGNGIYLIEEMENSIHPPALELMLQSLTSVYGAQVLLTTQSALALNHLEPEQVLYFFKDDAGAVHIVRGDRHPGLRNYLQDGNSLVLGKIFASGVLEWKSLHKKILRS